MNMIHITVCDVHPAIYVTDNEKMNDWPELAGLHERSNPRLAMLRLYLVWPYMYCTAWMEVGMDGWVAKVVRLSVDRGDVRIYRTLSCMHCSNVATYCIV